MTLVSFSRASDPPAALAHLRTVCHAVHTVPMTRSLAGEARSLARSLVSGQPYTLLRDERRAMHQLLQQLVQAEPFDAIHADQLAMADYAWQASRVAHASAPRGRCQPLPALSPPVVRKRPQPALALRP